MRVHVDTSIWIDYFRGAHHTQVLDGLIEEDLISTNELVMAELIPSLRDNNQHNIIALLKLLPVQKININWENLLTTQTRCI